MNAIEILTGLVRIPSVNPCGRPPDAAGVFGEQRLAVHIASLLDTIGIPSSIRPFGPDRCSLFATVAGRDQSRRLLFNAHLDTVGIEGMTIDPFGAEIRDGRLYGRGAVDDKASVAALLLALTRLHESGMLPPSSIHVILSGDEEYGTLGTRGLVDEGYRADACIMMEPTGLEIVVAHNGAARWQIRTTGKAIHSSRAHEGVNAITRMGRILSFIEETLNPELAKRVHPRCGPPNVNVGVISGGREHNTVPDSCEIVLLTRNTPATGSREFMDEVNARIRSFAEDQGIRIEISDDVLITDGLDTQRDERVVRVAAQSLRSCGIIPKYAGKPYGTDSFLLTGVGIPTIVFGPGSDLECHTPDESIDVTDVERAADVLSEIMLRF
jgi:acetylornithine deacetylase